MNISVNTSIRNVWNYLQGLSLSTADKHWLADRLLEDDTKASSETHKNLVFPHIDNDYKPSAEILAMSCGPLPEGFDVEKELDLMWGERAK